MNSKNDQKNTAALYKMTDTDLKIVLKTVNQKISESMTRAEQAHLQRLAQIQAHRSHGA
jgi:hypothetical protein